MFLKSPSAWGESGITREISRGGKQARFPKIEKVLLNVNPRGANKAERKQRNHQIKAAWHDKKKIRPSPEKKKGTGEGSAERKEEGENVKAFWRNRKGGVNLHGNIYQKRRGVKEPTKEIQSF